MREPGFGEALRHAGGVRRRESVPYPLTHDSIREMCRRREKLLRIQFEDEKFSDEDELVLETMNVDHPDGCFDRYKFLVGLWHMWESGRYGKGGASREDETEATRWLMLAREPVRIRVAGEVVSITSRSRAAMIRLYRHDERRKQLGEKLDLIEQKIEETHALRRSGRLGILAALRRRRKFIALRERIEDEWEVHFRGLLANALSPDGAAALPEHAPEWWNRVSLEDEAKILAALIEAGPARVERGTKPKKPSGKKSGEEMTFGSLLRYWEPKLHLPPMALENADLAQLVTALEDGASEGAASQELSEALT